jgi:hypothetical protein
MTNIITPKGGQMKLNLHLASEWQASSPAELREQHAGRIAQWRSTGCCTECGHVVVGDADVLDDHGVRFFGGAPHVPGDRVCFWCIEENLWEPEQPSRFQWGRA